VTQYRPSEEGPTTGWGYDGKYHPERPTPSEWRQWRMDKARWLGTHTKTEWKELRDRIGMCLGCGSRSRHLTKDHVIPIARGGCDCIQNIQPLCLPCNSKKGAK
jgi:5-methylcytosine-specific restriction endonuclease McrA